MIVSRYLLSCIKKAMKTNQKSVILHIKQIKNFQILNIICKYGFIQGYEIRGQYIIVHLKQLYWNSASISCDTSFEDISFVKRKKNSCSISAKKWNKMTQLSGSTACYIISTDQGIKDNHINTHIGGIPLIKIL